MEQQIKFNKSFEALYKSAMAMADNTIMAKTLDKRFDKLAEEYKELTDEFEAYYAAESGSNEALTAKVLMKKELGDVLFVLLHIAHVNGWTPFELLHQAMSKMLARMNDATYIAKN